MDLLFSCKTGQSLGLFIEQSPHSSAGLCDKIMKTLNSRIGLKNEVVNVDNYPHYLIVHYRDYKATVVIV